MNTFRRFLPLIIVGTVVALGALGYLTIEHYGLETLIATAGVAGVASIIFAESGLLIGFFLPGDSLLFTAGFLVHQHIIKFDIHLLVIILFFAAALGDNVGYAFGKRAGRRLFTRKESVVFKPENLRRAEEFYTAHGSKTIVMARFIPVVRTFAPIVAGMSKMNYRTFLTYNLLGAALWAVGLTYIGYFAGSLITDWGVNIEYVILGIIFISVLPPLLHILKDKKNRIAIKSAIKSQINALRK